MKLEDGASIPSYRTAGSAGADLYALLESSVVLPPGERVLVPTGVRLEIPAGYEVQIRPRSGWAYSHGITVLNSPGTIDSDYRGELKILLVNLGEERVIIANGDRVAQMVLAPVARAEFERTDRLRESARGERGFGHTGKR